MSAQIRVAALLVAIGAVVVTAASNESRPVESSPHAAALELVFKTEKAYLREIEKGDWWHDVEERTWTVKRPFMPGTIDSTHLFDVTCRIGGKEAASWIVDTARREVQRAKAKPEKEVP